jgi:hypothetical protein
MRGLGIIADHGMHAIEIRCRPGSAKNAILEFPHATTDPSSSKFVPPTAMTMSGLYLLEEGAGQLIRKVRFLFPK